MPGTAYKAFLVCWAESTPGFNQGKCQRLRVVLEQRRARPCATGALQGWAPRPKAHRESGQDSQTPKTWENQHTSAQLNSSKCKTHFQTPSYLLCFR